jgi:hypothetical protein
MTPRPSRRCAHDTRQARIADQRPKLAVTAEVCDGRDVGEELPCVAKDLGWLNWGWSPHDEIAVVGVRCPGVTAGRSREHEAKALEDGVSLGEWANGSLETLSVGSEALKEATGMLGAPWTIPRITTEPLPKSKYVVSVQGEILLVLEDRLDSMGCKMPAKGSRSALVKEDPHSRDLQRACGMLENRPGLV